MVRIHAGIYKGRKLKTVSSPEVRPTTARVKLSFFDIMQDEIRETVFLDGFGGGGNIGIEALSRGAEYVVFIEQLPEALRVLKHNLEKIGVPPEHFRIVRGEYNRCVIQLARENYKFDIVFLDPPYALLDYANPLKVLYKRNILKDNGIVVLERPSDVRIPDKYFECYRTHDLGRKSLDFFRPAPKGA